MARGGATPLRPSAEASGPASRIDTRALHVGVHAPTRSFVEWRPSIDDHGIGLSGSPVANPLRVAIDYRGPTAVLPLSLFAWIQAGCGQGVLPGSLSLATVPPRSLRLPYRSPQNNGDGQ
jgi:hypothetical protein